MLRHKTGVAPTAVAGAVVHVIGVHCSLLVRVPKQIKLLTD